MCSTVTKPIGEAWEEINLLDWSAVMQGIGRFGPHIDYVTHDTI